MIFLKLLLSSGLIFIAATTSVRNESLCDQPSMYIKPMHYDINLILHIVANIFHGECNISINIPCEARVIYLHLERLCIENISLFTKLEKYDENDTVMVYKPTYTIDITTNMIEIFFLDKLSPRNYTLNIKYIGIIDDGGFKIFNMQGSTVWVAATHLHKKGLFPCWDQPDLEATFNISVGCDRQYTVLSNMPVRNKEEKKYDMLWTHFETSPAMSPYLVTMIVFKNFVHLNDTGTITMWCGAHSAFDIKFAKNVAENITLYLKDQWKPSNNISNMNHIAIPNFQDRGITVLGLVLYRETDIIYNEKLYPVSRKIEVARLVERKVIQEWFYNLFNSSIGSNFWNEGLLTFSERAAVNKIFPNKEIRNLLIVQAQHNSLHLDGDYYMWPFTSQVNSSLEIPNSIRAPCILRMMRKAITDNIFWKVIRSYINSTQLHRQNFTNFMAKVVVEANSSDKILQSMQCRSMEKHYPVINIIRNYNHTLGQVNISIQNFDTLKNYCIPLTNATQTNPNFNRYSPIWLDKWSNRSSVLLSFRKDGWVIFNIQQIGYYRVNYDNENWLRISNYLNFDNYTKIHVLNRAQIIDDAFHLMIAGQLDSFIFWNVTSYLHREENYIAWYPMFKALEYMFRIFPVLDERFNDFTTKIRHTLDKVLERIEYEEIDDRDELRICLRQEAAKWACFFNDSTCKKKAENKLEEHLSIPERQQRLLPWWKKWTYCNALMTTFNVNIWQSVYNIGLKRYDTKLSEFLPCSNISSVIIHYLNLIKNKTRQNITEPEYQYHVHSFLHIIIKHANNQTILNYILENFHEIKPKHVSTTTVLIIIINNIYSVRPLELLNGNVEKLIEGKLLNVTSEVPSTDNFEKITNIGRIDMKQLTQNVKRRLTSRFYQLTSHKYYFYSFF